MAIKMMNFGRFSLNFDKKKEIKKADKINSFSLHWDAI